jgi:hypothetical protein
MRSGSSKASRAPVSVCRHDGFHTAASHYDHSSEVMRFMLVCDACGAAVKDVTRVEYRPHFDRGQTRQLAA